MDPQPDFDAIARRVVARQLTWGAAGPEPVTVIAGIEYALVVQDGDLTRATLWEGQSAVARVDLSSLTVEAGASC